jgi:hypothetical protein
VRTQVCDLRTRGKYFLADTDDPDHWRRQAIEARRVAQMLSDRTAQQHLLECAKYYDRLALLGAKTPITWS